MIVVGIVAVQPVIRLGLAAVALGEDTWRVGHAAATVDDFVETIECHSCAVVVVDSRDPHVRAGLGALASRGFGVVSWSDDPSADRAAGANGAVSTDAAPGDLRSCIIDAFTSRPGANSFCVSQLTTRQLEVLVLVGGGLANKQIANLLGVSISTVKRHMEQLMERTGRHNRAGLAALAADLGELRPETLSVLNRDAAHS